MQILLRLTTRSTGGLFFVLTALAALMPGQVRASMTISDPVGVHSIGKAIDLKSTVSGIADGAESQIRATCLRGRILPMESSGAMQQPIEVQVEFQPTIRQGGLIGLRTNSAINHALVKLELVSECPLVVFDTTWTLIMEEQSPANQPLQPSIASPQRPPTFDLATSALLKQSRKAPKLNKPAHTPTETPAIVDVIESDSEPETKPNTEQLAPEVHDTEVPDTVKLASLDQRLLNNGLIESEHTEFAIGSGLSFGQIGQASNQSAWFSGLELPIGAVALALLAALVYWSRRQRKNQPALVYSAVKSAADPNIVLPEVNEFRIATATDTTASPAYVDQFRSNRVLESLMGSEDSGFETMSEVMDSFGGEVHDSVSVKESLKISLEMSQRADIPRWNLPLNYQALVEHRNNSLETLRNTEALILRCHIGVVELAFQESMQGQTMSAETPNELLQCLLGHRVYEVEDMPTLGVPDILKSYVKAKVCDVVGAENRRIFRENLLNLNIQVKTQAMCFHTNAWREFLSEEGLLN